MKVFSNDMTHNMSCVLALITYFLEILSKNTYIITAWNKCPARPCMLKCVSLLYYWIAMWPQQTLCHHAEEKKASETSWGVQSVHRHVIAAHTHTSWRQAFMCGCKNKNHRQAPTSLHTIQLHVIRNTFELHAHTLKHTHLQTQFKASVFINTPTHTCMHLLVARPTLKSPLLSHSLSHTSTCRETHTYAHTHIHTQPYPPPLSSWPGEVDPSQSVSCHVNQCFLGHKTFGRQKDWVLLTTPRVNHGHALLTPLLTHKHRRTVRDRLTTSKDNNSRRLYEKTKHRNHNIAVLGGAGYQT